MHNRIRFLDVLRILCFLFVLYYHIIVQIGIMGWIPTEQMEYLYTTANAHLATLAVSTFFMISGAGLMLSTRNHFHLLTYYKKRVIRILIPFYVVYSLTLITRIIMTHGLKGAFMNDNIPVWRFIFTIFGMDEWINMHGYATFTLSIGEWFLGCLIILYILFPLIRFLMLKNPYITFGSATIIYLFISIFYPFSVAPFMNGFLKAYDFILGMFLILFWNKDRYKILLISLPIFIFWIFYPYHIPVKDSFSLTIVSTAFFLSFSKMENLFQRISWKPVLVICDHSYELFLIHHIIIYQISAMANPYVHGIIETIIVIIVELFATLIATLCLHRLNQFISFYFSEL